MLNINPPAEFWRNKKVFITGHTGFKGGWLSLWLQYLGANIVGFSLKPTTDPNLFHLINIEQDITSFIGDIRHFEQLKKVLEDFQPEIAFHLAAQPLVRYAYQQPIDTYTTNVIGTVHVLEALRKTSAIKAIINITTDKCYANKEWYWGYRENDPLGGDDPYSSSKACSELVTVSYRHSFFREKKIGLASVRAGNVIGGGDWAIDRLIPDFIRAKRDQQAVIIRNPQAIRPWQHVLEPLHGYLMLAERLYHSPEHYSEAWNFGPNEQDVTTVNWIADFLSQRLTVTCSKNNDHHPHETHHLRLDSTKAKSKLNWLPHWELVKALEKTIDWYQAYQNGENMRNFTLQQIKNYSNEKNSKPPDVSSELLCLANKRKIC